MSTLRKTSAWRIRSGIEVTADFASGRRFEIVRQFVYQTKFRFGQFLLWDR
jgi:hypothetical protein